MRYVPAGGTCGDGCIAVKEILILYRLAGYFGEYVPVFLAGNICVLNQSGRKGARNYSRTFGRIEVPRRARIV